MSEMRTSPDPEVLIPTEQDRGRLMQFAAQLDPSNSKKATRRIAMERGWIDSRGRITDEGLELLRALAEQAKTRTVFRQFS